MPKLVQFEEWMDKGQAAPFKDIISGAEIQDEKAKALIHNALINQWNYMDVHKVEDLLKPESRLEAPTAKITGEALKPYIKEKHFTVIKKCGKPYAIGCVLCIYKHDDKYFGDIRTAYATVNPADKYDEAKGKHLAYERALGIDITKPGTLEHGVARKYDAFVDKYDCEYVCDDYEIPKVMFPLIRAVMPKLVANKYVKEFGEVTDETSIRYIKK